MSYSNTPQTVDREQLLVMTADRDAWKRYAQQLAAALYIMEFGTPEERVKVIYKDFDCPYEF